MFYILIYFVQQTILIPDHYFTNRNDNKKYIFKNCTSLNTQSLDDFSLRFKELNTLHLSTLGY